MKKYLQVIGIAVLISALIGCVSQETKTALGALGGGVLGGVIGKKVGGDKGAIAGALVGAAIGGTLTHLLTKEDKENIANILEESDNTNQTYSWCSGSRSIQTGDLGSCGADDKKIMATPGKIKTVSTDSGQQECRDLQLEVTDDTGKIESVVEKSCKGSDGKWHTA